MLLPIALATLLTLFIALAIAISIRLHTILPPYRPRPVTRRRASEIRRSRAQSLSSKYDQPHRRSPSPFVKDGGEYGHILIVLGSGGHTAEMMLLLGGAGVGLERWKKRSWVLGKGDGFSAQRAGDFERNLEIQKQGKGKESETGGFDILTIPRARRIHQSLFTTPISSLQCLWACLKMLRQGEAPDIILTNGPGTGVIVVLASIILRCFDFSPPSSFSRSSGASKTRIIYVESLARVKKLSLSGRILGKLVDRFLVQWEELEGEYRGAITLAAAMACGIRDSGGGKEDGGVEAPRIRYEI